MNGIRLELKRHITLFPESGKDRFEGVFSFPAESPVFDGHFPGSPVLPGICLVISSLIVAEQLCGRSIVFRGVNSAKFFAPVLPDHKVVFNGSLTAASGEKNGNIFLKVDFLSENQKVARLRLLVD